MHSADEADALLHELDKQGKLIVTGRGQKKFQKGEI